MTDTGIKKSKSNLAFIIPVAVILALYSISMFAPLLWGLLTSFKSQMDFSIAGNVLGLPDPEFSAEAMRFGNYKIVLDNLNFDKTTVFYSGSALIEHSVTNNIWIIIWNSFLYAVMGSLVQVMVPCVIGYLAAKFPGKFSNFLNVVVLVVMTMPLVGTYAAELTLLRRLRIYDTFVGNFIQKFNFANMYFFVFQAYYKGISNSYSEAAEIDGASQMRILTTLMIPLAQKIIGTVFLILFVRYWNDYQTPLLYLPTKTTLAYAVYHITYEVNQAGMGAIPAKIAGCMMLAVPIMIIYLIFQDKLMGNISMGGVKE